MRIFYIPSEHREDFINVISKAHNIIYTPLEDSRYVRFHDASLNDLPTVHIKPARHEFGQPCKAVSSTLLAQLQVIPIEAVYIFLRDLVRLPNE